MAKRKIVAEPRTRPGPRPRAHRSGVGDHGAPRRRTAHQPSPRPTKSQKSQKARATAPRSIPARRETPSAHAPASVAKWWLLVGIVCTAAFCVAVLEAPFFEANSVQLSGAARTSEGAILAALDLPDDQALLTYGTNDGAEAIGALPWVKSVEVTRQWPSTVRVVIRERTATAAIGSSSGSSWFVVGEDGVVVEQRMTPPVGVPVIIAHRSITSAASVGDPLVGVDRVLTITQELPLQLAPWVTTWSVDTKGRVVARLVGSASVNFGAFEDHRTQFVSLASLLNGGADLVCLEQIDLSVGDTPVLYRNPQCMLEAQSLT